MDLKNKPALIISEIEYDYPGNWIFDKKPVLKPFSLTVESGESFGFLGHNGAGKSTTIKSILNVNRIKKGAIEIFGIPHTSPEARKLIGYLPEQPYFYDHLTIEEMLGLYGTLSGLKSQNLSKAIDWALDTVKISKRRNEKLRSLSKGLVQRASLAQAILAKPKLLILDEPFSGLDPIGRKDFKEIFVSLKEEGTTIFMSSHILSDVEFLCTRVSIMSKGSLKGIFSVKEIPSLSAARYQIICEESKESRALLSSKGAVYKSENSKLICSFESRDTAEKSLQELLSHRVRIDSFHTVQDSLEDVFVRIVQFDESARG